LPKIAQGVIEQRHSVSLLLFVAARCSGAHLAVDARKNASVPTIRPRPSRS
jgi:hypothetical protein